MRAYLDSSALIKLYVKEEKSAFVASYVKSLKMPLPFSFLHEIELKNALRLKVFRKEGTPTQVQASIRLMDRDLISNVLERAVLDWADVFGEAEELSHHHAASVGCRSLDLLHVASACLLEAKNFLTFDTRQMALALEAGLVPVAPPPRVKSRRRS